MQAGCSVVSCCPEGRSRRQSALKGKQFVSAEERIHAPVFFSGTPCILRAVLTPPCRLCILRVVLPLQMLTRMKTIILLCLYAGNIHTHKGSLCAELGV